MEKGGDEVPRIVQVMYFKQMPRPAVPQNGSQQPDTALPQQWETQWPEFLKTLQPAHVGWGNPPVMESAPWDDAKTFLSSFEEVAEACQWPREQWVGRLLPALRGGVKQCLWRLNARDRRDYEKVKSAVLRDDAIRTEAKRQHFRQCGYREGPRTVYSQLQELCRQWLKPDRRTKEQILELIVQEQLLAMLPQEVQRMVRECAPEDCIETVALAENFLMSCQGTRTWEQQVPVPEGTVGSLETEGAVPNVARRQFCVGINQKGNGEIGLMANEITATRNSGVVLPPEGQEVAGAGQAEEPVDAKNVTLDNAGWTEEDLDQKPPRWDVMQQNSGSASTSDGLLIPTPDTVSQPEQQEAAFTQILENGETVPGSLLGGRILSEIKTEDSEQSDVDVEGVPEEEHQYNVSKSPEPSTQRELRPRKPEEQQGRATRRRRRRAVIAKKASKCLPREKRYECPECGYRVAFLSDLLRHLKTHSGKRPYKCLECGKTFSRLDSFHSHQRIHIPTADADSSKKIFDDCLSSHQGAKQYVCPRCGFKAMALKELTEHMTVHRGERRYTCPECGKTFGWKSNLSRHRRLHLVRNDFGVRKLVHRGGEGPGKLKNHSLQHYKIKLENVLGTSSGVVADAREPSVSSRLRPRKPQQESEFSFGALRDAASLSRPMSKFRSRKHQEKGRGGSCQLGRAAVAVKRSINYGKKKKHACQQCEYRSERLSDVVKHMRVHTKERPYNCLDCGVSFRWLSNYTEHKKRCTYSQRTPVPEAPVAECDVWLSDDEELINILQKNSQQQGTGSKASTNIVSSTSKTGVVGTKSKQLPKEWRMQGKASRRQRNTVNMTTNKYRPKERKHECSECGHRTFYLSDLIRHLRVHTREKPYKCLQCGKAFAQQSTLNNHEKTHKSGGAPSSGKNDIRKKASSLGEKNYTCSKCGHRTAKLAALLKHMRVHLGERPYKCEDCGETFAWHSILCRHQRIHKLDRAPSGRKTPVAGREEMSEGDNEAPSKMREEKSQQERTELKKTSTTAPEIAHGNISLTAGSGSSKDEKTAPKKEQTESIKGTEDRVAGKELVKRINLEMFAYSKGEKSCQSQSGLVTDPLISEKEKPHESSECEKSYSIKCSLMKFQHEEPEVLPEETEEKPYICSDCGECFSVKARLSRHQLKHTGVRPYICSECGHSYYRRDALMTHLKIHGLSMTKDAPSLAKDALGQSTDEASVKLDRTESS